MTSAATPPAPHRRTLSLQARLITAVIGMVAVMLVAIGFATGTILSSIMRENLDSSIRSSLIDANNRVGLNTDASDLLMGREQIGTVLVLNLPTGLTGAYVTASGEIADLTDDQIAQLVTSVGQSQWGTASVSDLGEYRVAVAGHVSGAFLLLGLPTSEITQTLGQIVTTVALVTTGGLMLLSVVLTLVIGRGLKPLREVAATAERVARQPLSEGQVAINERVPPHEADERTEIGRMGAALNTLLDHVETSLAARQRNEERMRRFVADASHELRTPLASIRGYSELSLRALHQRLAGNAEDADPATRMVVETTESALERIQAQSLRMTDLVEDLLLLARLEEGQELVFGTVDLSRLAIEATGDARVAGPDHGWRLEIGEDPVYVAGDEARLHQVLANLLANARTHTPAGTNVTVSIAREADEAVIRVHDDGPGVDPEVADELFERFSRGDLSRTRKTGGTGLGLSIARAIVEGHGGRLTVHSVPGDTTFAVWLPARPLDPSSTGTEADEESGAADG